MADDFDMILGYHGANADGNAAEVAQTSSVCRFGHLSFVPR